jgi:hypothetical protein
LKPLGGMRTQFEPLDRSSNARPIPPHPPLRRQALEPSPAPPGRDSRNVVQANLSEGRRAPHSGTDRPKVGPAGVEADGRNQHSQFEPLDRSPRRPIPPHPPLRHRQLEAQLEPSAK